MADFTIFGSNRELIPGTYTEEDTVTFVGTRGNDTLLGGGGELYAYFRGTAGTDVYGGSAASIFGYADYSDAPRRVVINMDFTGTRTFTDESGDVRTVSILGKALKDGFGGIDYFMEDLAFGSGLSSISGVIGSDFNDTMIGSTFFEGFHGGGGNDRLVGNFLYGDEGDDHMVGRGMPGDSVLIEGGVGDDFILGTDGPDRTDVYLVGEEGNDRIFAGAGDDTFLTGNEGNDYVDGGAGNDFIDGGVGADRLVSGSGSDIINPDVEEFQTNPNQARDGARDRILVTRDDLGDFTDVVLSRAFEAGLDEVRFRDAAAGGRDYRLYYEAQTINEATGRPYLTGDLAGTQNTVLQIDQNGNGFGSGAPDSADYFLSVVDVTLSEHSGFLLS